MPQRHPVRQTQTFSNVISERTVIVMLKCVCFVQARAEVSALEIPPITSLYKTDVETCGDFHMSKSNMHGVSGHITVNEVQYQLLFSNPMQSRGSACFLQYKGRNRGKLVDRSEFSIFKPSVQEEIPPKSVGPWLQRSQMIRLHNRKPMKSKNVAETT
jgi:hypothetical protein